LGLEALWTRHGAGISRQWCSLVWCLGFVWSNELHSARWCWSSTDYCLPFQCCQFGCHLCLRYVSFASHSSILLFRLN
jgi:hypothetical protein